MNSTMAKREHMVRVQLKARNITSEKVLAAMLKTPRHEFVPTELSQHAYDDNALPLKLGQTISQPYIVAFMTQLLELDEQDRVLEIGTGCGYQTAILAGLAKEVYTVEIIPELMNRASEVLNRLEYRNICFRAGDGYLGWPEKAPFDKIIVTAAPESIPQPLIDQIKEGGKLVIPVGVGVGDQELVVLSKEKSGITRQTSIPVRFVPMTGKALEFRSKEE
jgi:protein-L-isoaspartate(D-aspartate) O-methyltransferase